MKKWRGSEVTRAGDGRFASQSRQSAEVRDIKTTAARRNDMEDRRDERLRWGPAAVAKVWFMPTGPSYWVPRGSSPTTIRGNYYIPTSPWPIVPPRSTWPRYDSYSGVAGRSVLSQLVPTDIWRAAAGTSRRDPGESPRKEINTGRRRRTTDALNEPPAKKGVTRISRGR